MPGALTKQSTSATATTPTATRAQPRASSRRCTALTPTASRHATPKTTSGTARAELRSAKPAVDVAENDLNAEPNGELSGKGDTPTPSTTPTTVKSTKYVRYRHRTQV